jgi:glycosyltransferase involved in cell wall biosynthesis
MRILLFFWGGGEGGDASAMLELARAFQCRNIEFDLAAHAFTRPDIFRRKACAYGLPEPVFVEDPSKVFENTRLHPTNFDLIHVHHGAAVPKRTYIAPLRTMAGGWPMVLTAHGPTPLNQITYGGWKSRLSRIVSATWFKAVIVPSKAKVAEWKAMTLLNKNVVAIPNVVRFFQPVDKACARARLSIQATAKVALFCSRLDAEKRPLSFIQAIREASKSDPHIVGLMAGSGELLEECESTILENDAPVRLLGYRDDLESLYSAADVFVQPSLYESFCITLLQAAALGIPCVAADIPVFREMYDGLQTFSWWTSEHSTDLAAQMLEAFSDRPAANELGAVYSEEKVVEAHLKLYRRVLKR